VKAGSHREMARNDRAERADQEHRRVRGLHRVAEGIAQAERRSGKLQAA
jgi:hypothetical protein